MKTTDTPRVYIACLACYNDGRLHGVWVDAVDADAMSEAQTAMQAACGHTDNDWAIHDNEGFGSLTVSESMAFDDVAKLGELIEKHGAAFIAYAENIGADYATESGFDDSYLGEYPTRLDYAYELADEMLHGAPEFLAHYFDYESFSRDLFSMDGYSFVDGFVFRDC